jgi:hypothetical protein
MELAKLKKYVIGYTLDGREGDALFEKSESLGLCNIEYDFSD